MRPLRQRMLDAMQLRGMAARTCESYLDAVARPAQHPVQPPARPPTQAAAALPAPAH